MNKPQIILGIETSCDETAAAVVKKSGDRVTILSNVVASSAELQSKYGGVIPEQAAREQLRSIIPVIQEALTQTFPSVIPTLNLIQGRNLKIKKESGDPSANRLRMTGGEIQDNIIKEIDAIAVTNGPGLIGSLLVGVETAKTLATIWNKPLIPINHLIGHFYANWIGDQAPSFPCLGLLVSGGHTDLVLFKTHGQYEYLGGTRDDAAGECFDKCARLLNLPYPGGPQISKLAIQGNASKFDLPRPMINSKDFDFSFSGLKTAVANLLKETQPKPADLAASIEQAIVDVLVAKTLAAAKKYQVKEIIIAGGVAANQKLASELKLKITRPSFGGKNLKLKINLHIPSANLCTDNAVMIAAAACFNYHPLDPLTLQANSNLSL